jgi:PAS domain-containing protein
VALDSLELQLVSALQRYTSLQRRAESQRDPGALVTKTLAELATALEEVRVAQDQLIESRLRMERLQAELQEQQSKYWRLFDEMPQAYVVTKPDSTIIEVNKAGAQLFNVSQRFLIGKAFSVFVCEERGPFLVACSRVAAESSTADLPLKIRPRERAPMSVNARVSGDTSGLRWVLHQVPSAAVPTAEPL